MSLRRLSGSQRRDWVRLVRTPNIGPLTFTLLIERFGNATDALAALPYIASRVARGRRFEVRSAATIEDEIAATQRLGARIIASCEPEFPKLLVSLDLPPPLLTVLGNLALAQPDAVAIVGARNASAAGRKIERDIAAALGRAGLVTVSGLALGIDGEAHAASLGTVAVLGGGIDHIYPPQHERLYRQIADQGLIVSESPTGYKARAQYFPRRNRVITGLAWGTVLVEAAERSGSLISARMAGELGREVMAVPGSPLDPRAARTNSLLRQGAVLVRHAADVLEVLAGLAPLHAAAPPPPAPTPEFLDSPVPESQVARLRTALSPHPMPADEMARPAGLNAAKCNAVLMELELGARRSPTPAAWWPGMFRGLWRPCTAPAAKSRAGLHGGWTARWINSKPCKTPHQSCRGRQPAQNAGTVRIASLAFWSRFALLAGFSAVMPFAAHAQDAAAAAAEAPDERVILEADTVYELAGENSIVAEGNVEALYQGRTLRADRLVYNRTTEKVRANGNVIIIDTDGSQQFADELEVGSNLTDGYAIGFSARLAEGATVAANSGVRTADGINALEQVVYTSCVVCEKNKTPTWSIRARRAVLDQNSQMISYRDAVVEVAGIPVFYLPYLAHPDPSSDRRSGFLIPDAGVSSKLGTFYKQPYYWAISESSDLVVEPLLSANVNPVMNLEYRKRFYSGAVKVEGSFTQEADFNGDGERFGEEKFRGHVYANGAFAITPNWLWGFAVENQTDDLYDRRYDIEGQTDKRGLYANQPRRLLSQIYAVGQGNDYYADVAVLQSQGLRGQDDANRLPVIAPLLYAEKNWDLGKYGFANANVSSAVLTRDVGADSQRVSAGADWRDFNLLPGGVTFEPFVEVRGDFYALDEAVSGKSNVTRAVGNAGAKLAYPMIRPCKNVDLMLEPAVMAAWGFSNANDPAIPVEDSQLYEFDESSMYDPNGFSNFDLYEGDGKVSAGLTARALWKNGAELSTSVGRRWRSRSDEAFDVASNLDGTSSDWVGTASVGLGSALQLSSRVRLDDEEFSLNRLDVRLSTSLKRFRAVGQYYKIDQRISPLGQPDEGVYVQGEVQLTQNYSILFGQLRDIAGDLDARQEVGIAYSDDCSRFELIYSRNELFDRTLGPSENIQFRFTLKSLGNFGSENVD